jgi:arylsulfatase A-like enzyme
MKPAYHRLEGRSLLPILRGENVGEWRDFVFSELDYSFYRARLTLERKPAECRIYMVRDARWKYIHFTGYRPQLFDLQDDPRELRDLGESPDHAQVRDTMREKLFDRLLSRRNRVTVSDEAVEERTNKVREKGIIIGEW